MNKNRQNKRKHNPSNIKYGYSVDKHFMPNCNILCGKLLLAESFKPLKLRDIINTCSACVLMIIVHIVGPLDGRFNTSVLDFLMHV